MSSWREEALVHIIAWLKFVVSFAVAWLVTGIAVVLVMSSSTPDGGTSHPFWAAAILVVPVVGGFFAGRFFSHRDFETIAAKRDASRRSNFLANQAVEDAERWRIRQFLHQNVDQHRAALQRNIRNAVVKNDYGKTVSDKRAEALIESSPASAFLRVR